MNNNEENRKVFKEVRVIEGSEAKKEDDDILANNANGAAVEFNDRTFKAVSRLV